MGVTIERDGRGVAHCFRCNMTESYRPKHGASVVSRAKSVPVPLQARKYDELSDYGRALWSETQPLAGVAVAYLEARRCHIPPVDSDLRFHPRLKHPSGYVGPALVGLITDALTGRPLSLHRTWVDADGNKADVDPPRLLLGRHRKQGGVIRLWPDEAVTYGLGIAEGIETALSLAWAHGPVWSLIDAGNLAVFPYLRGIESIVIAADNDPAGKVAARTCAVRWADAGAEVVVTRQLENDLNDTLQEGLCKKKQ
ncbi:toprim domain-containing protein [Paraburkholderia sp. MM5384-R2]|uniref:DUF7146 domain-containing protein n=1 Tax=Paraburkholderia sp. MM5384-R2 TaxID=2723097 RepID=UPI001607644A|nr:toprim domain-containing protein [Paraburkholderia sp. MM5384-R2]MBB5503271.1 hypothetical protein [Paraburkholderia sp. MM5384-R2]